MSDVRFASRAAGCDGYPGARTSGIFGPPREMATSLAIQNNKSDGGYAMNVVNS
jgi:hypothetical protein